VTTILKKVSIFYYISNQFSQNFMSNRFSFILVRKNVLRHVVVFCFLIMQLFPGSFCLLYPNMFLRDNLCDSDHPGVGRNILV
jgi:hypothetical protein